MIRHLPADAALWRHLQTAPPTRHPRTTSTPDQIRAAGGRFVHSPRKTA